MLKFNKKYFYESKCPNCGNDSPLEITGWCCNHNGPMSSWGDYLLCKDHEGGEITNIVEDAWYCEDCNALFDEKKIVRLDEYTYHGCPVGKELPEDYYEMKDYEGGLKKLNILISKYDEEKIKDCLSREYYLEAIGTMHIQISRLLRYSLIIKMIDSGNIPLQYDDKKFKKITAWLIGKAAIGDEKLYNIAYIFNEIDSNENQAVTFLNSIRNTFAHSFRGFSKYTNKQLTGAIDKVKPIEQRLREKCLKFDIHVLITEIDKKTKKT